VSRINLGLGATSKRKVYLLDEVHMLTSAAANTLLKSIEEPPAHVVFILATTEPDRVLPTIRSRTQHFEFSYLTVEQIVGLLASVLDGEGVAYEPEALATIARAAGGSARDSESLLDLVLATGGPVTADAVGAALGGAPFELRMTILDAVAAGDVAGVLTGVAALLDAAHDPRQIAEGLLASLRDSFLLVAAGGRIAIDEPAEVTARLQEVGDALGTAALVRSMETLGQAVVDMRGTEAADPRLVLEIALVRLARRESGNVVQTLVDRVERLEARLAGGATPSAGADASGPPAGAEPRAGRSGKPPALGALRKAAGRGADPAPAPDAPAPAPAPDAAPAAAEDGGGEVGFDLDDVIVAWAAVLDALPRSLRASIQEAQPVRVDGNVIVFGVARSHIDTVKPKFQRNADAIREAFIAQLDAPPRFAFTPHEWSEGEGPPHRLQVVPDPEPEPPVEDEPIDLAEIAEFDDAPNDAGAAVDSLSRLTDTFGATVVDEQPKS
jgi:DNA polymerase III delta subunit